MAITGRVDDINVYLTLQCREFRPDLQIISRATSERTVPTLYRAGADVVLSYVPMEANAIFGVVSRGTRLLLAEGLDIFTVAVPRSLAGRTIAAAGLREDTGCNLLALRTPGGPASAPDPAQRLPADGDLILIGTPDAARQWFERYG